MKREYELFERFPDESLMWRGHIAGLQEARGLLDEIARQTSNECFVMHLGTQEVLFRANVAGAAQSLAKQAVFQIAYDEHLGMVRAALLRTKGYHVAWVVGNDAAMVMLCDRKKHFDLFIVGHNARDEQRRKMVAWLKENYPGVKILAINPTQLRELPGADYNAVINGPENWMPFVSSATSSA